MRSHAGVAATAFKALADKGINIRAITTSEIKISILIDGRLRGTCGSYLAFRLRSGQAVNCLKTAPVSVLSLGKRTGIPGAAIQLDFPAAPWRRARMRGAAAGPRVLLKRLREVMAEPLERTGAARQDRQRTSPPTWWRRSARSMCCAPTACSSSTRPRASIRGAVHQASAAARPGPGRHDRRNGAAAQPDGRAEPSGLRLPAGDRRGDLTTPSSACRSCGPGARSAFLSCRTRPSAPMRDDEVEALETTAMVLAEMIAAGELRRPDPAGNRARPDAAGAALRVRPSTRASALAMSCCTSRASSSPTSSTRMSRAKIAPAASALGSLRLSIDDMLARREVAIDGRASRGARSLSHVRQ